ncbi:hypothetical protein GXW82_24695 [Streptacidiphilus sp. 4-A2]|nr:hypothetical protein [Streptacidiphilus sp. 4-A2]
MDTLGVVQDDWIEGVPHQYGVSSLLPVVYAWAYNRDYLPGTRRRLSP